MGNYISFFDLLGTKAIASYNPKLYFENINSFQQALQGCSSILENSNFQIKAFSDCAYVESNDLALLLEYLQNLREILFMKQIFFNAAVTKGQLKSPIQDNTNERIVCVSFRSPETVKVFTMQSQFYGIGVFIDRQMCSDDCKTVWQKYIVNSAYCIGETDGVYNKFAPFYDLKYNSVSLQLVKFLLMNYLKTITLNKKAARYYLSALLTCINQLSYDSLVGEYLPLFSNKSVFDSNKTLFNDMIPIHLMLINRLYNSFVQSNPKQSPNSGIGEQLDKIIENSALGSGFDNLQIYSDELISKENKYHLTDYISKRIIEKISTKY